MVHLPGGNTRSVLHYEPFPYRVASAEGAVQTDLDGLTYVDFCGNYTAGLFGQSEPVVRDAIVTALDEGWAIGAVREQEARLAALLCARFPSLDQVRFTNSGTEANLMAIGTALHHTGRDGVLVFDKGYHGGVLSFGGAGVAGSPLNAPYDFTVAEWDDADAAVALIESGRFGCVLVEPVQGSGGCRVPSDGFLAAVRDVRDGQLNDTQFGRRGRGTGARAEQLAQTFRIFAARAGLSTESAPISSAAFRRPNGQLDLFPPA